MKKGLVITREKESKMWEGKDPFVPKSSEVFEVLCQLVREN